MEYHDLLYYKPVINFCQYRGTPREIYSAFFYNNCGIPQLKAGYSMNINDAIVKRIEEICKERNSNVCDIALRGGMSPSAIYDIIKGRTKCSKVVTIKRFCEGAGITLSEFFDRDYFNVPEED